MTGRKEMNTHWRGLAARGSNKRGKDAAGSEKKREKRWVMVKGNSSMTI